MNEDIYNILFLDIETVACSERYDELDERLKVQWSRKAHYLNKEEGMDDAEFFDLKAGIYAEFGKVITIALGYFSKNEKAEPTLRITTLSDHDEAQLLKAFKAVLAKFANDHLLLCAHNGKEFDFPYLSRRMLVNGIRLPDVLNLSGKKPWEVKHLDTLDLWKFGDRKHFTSLELLCCIFGITSSKSGIDGSQVNEVYYREKDLERIADYCAQDVAATAQVYLKMKGLEDIDASQIHFVTIH